MKTKAEFFKEMKECRVNATAFITVHARNGSTVALVMQQSGAPNAFLSRHKDGSEAMKKAQEKYEEWLNEFFMSGDEVVEADHVDAIEEDRQVQALLMESDEVVEMNETELKDVVEITHEAALVMNEEIDVLSQRLADCRCYFYSEEQIHHGQQEEIANYKRHAFDNGPRIIQHILKVIVISKRRCKLLKGYVESPPPPGDFFFMNEHELPF